MWKKKTGIIVQGWKQHRRSNDDDPNDDESSLPFTNNKCDNDRLTENILQNCEGLTT